MKVIITYLPGEEREADLVCRFARSLLGSAQVYKSDRHPTKEELKGANKYGPAK